MHYKRIFNSILSKISDLLSSDAFLESYRMPKRFVRKRLLSMRHVVFYLLHTIKQNMDKNIERMIDLGDKLDFPRISKQALSKARQGIDPGLFAELFNVSVNTFYENADPHLLKWHDKFHVFAIDGTKTQLPCSDSNYKFFGEMHSKDNPDRRWSMALGSIIYDVSNDYICHGLINPYLSSERSCAKEHCLELIRMNIFHHDAIVVFDRGYYSENMFRFLSDHGINCVMRLKEGFSISKKCNGDSVSVLPGSELDNTDDIRIRVVSVQLDSGITEYLGTNIFDDTLSSQDFKDLYWERWNIEKKYFELKHQHLLEEFSGATAISVQQEFYINLLYSNIDSLAKAHADKKIEEHRKETNKHKYQANRAYIIGRVKEIFVKTILHIYGPEKIDDLFKYAWTHKSQKQPDRKGKPRKKKRDRTHFNNRKLATS